MMILLYALCHLLCTDILLEKFQQLRSSIHLTIPWLFYERAMEIRTIEFSQMTCAIEKRLRDSVRFQFEFSGKFTECGHPREITA